MKALTIHQLDDKAMKDNNYSWDIKFYCDNQYAYMLLY